MHFAEVRALDGHNRYEIAQKHNLTYKTIQRKFDSEDAAKLWIIDNQFGRRNLPKADRIILAQHKSSIIAEMARARQAAAGGDKKSEKAKNAFIKNDKSDTGEKQRKPVSVENKAEQIIISQTDDQQKQEPNPQEKKVEPVHTQKEVAKLAGVSAGTVAQFEQIQKKKPEAIEQIRN